MNPVWLTHTIQVEQLGQSPPRYLDIIDKLKDSFKTKLAGALSEWDLSDFSIPFEASRRAAREWPSISTPYIAVCKKYPRCPNHILRESCERPNMASVSFIHGQRLPWHSPFKTMQIKAEIIVALHVL